jgi:betaine-aldehyde dehydrogenase
MRTFHNIVDGKPVQASDGRTLDIHDPKTGEVYATSPLSGPADVDAAYQSAQRAFQNGWGDTTPSDRMNGLLALAAAVEEHGPELAELEAQNTGKPLGLTLSEEIGPMVDQLRFFAGAARHLEGRATAEYMEGHSSSIRREPLGVIGSVAPWNYPMMMAVWKIGPALAAGNTLVLKPSDTTPASTVRLGELAAEVLPPGVLNIVCGDRSTGAAMTDHDIPAMVAITGSVAAGKAVAAAAAPRVKRVHLELGGNAPVVVFSDADIAAAAAAAPMAVFGNAGQDCCARSRILVQEQALDEFMAALEPVVKGIAVGDPLDEATQMGPLISARQRENVAAYVTGDVAIQGSAPDGPGYWFPPTVLTPADKDSPAVREEIFGPVVVVVPFRDEADAIALANDTIYGLSGSIWTRDGAKALRVARAVDTGVLSINSNTSVRVSTPFGGFKQSGYGRELGPHALDAYTELKTVYYATGG